jgi:glycosyltransferase involved in cell wall biosynthesis
MKILHVVPSFGLGGMERVICTLINHTSLQYTHSLLSLSQETSATKWLTTKTVEVAIYEKRNRGRRLFRALYDRLRATQPTVLMTYNWGATDLIWLGRLVGMRNIIHSEHGVNIDEAQATNWKRDLMRLVVYRLASRVVVVTQSFFHAMQAKYRLNKERIAWIPNGVKTDYYAPDLCQRAQTRQALGLTENDFVLGFSGRLDPIKNLGLLLHAFTYCVKGSALPPRLLIIGDGPEKERLTTICQQEGIEDRVIFTGQQEDVLPYLRAMDVFLLTSLREQMPLTILEAMAVGIPIVATKVGEIPTIVTDGVNGVLLDLHDSAERFAREIISLGAMVTRRKRMGAAARERIVSSFQEETMVQAYINLMESYRDS